MCLNIKKTHRGISSLFETVTCVALISLLIVALLSIMAATTVATMESQQAVAEKANTDFFIENLQVDVKSALFMETPENTQILLTRENELVLYRLEEGTLYRNDEIALTNINSSTFVSEDGDTLGIYITRENGEIIDLTISR